jgi:hypothetical protein
MNQSDSVCQYCSAPLGPGITFCGQCGKPVAAPSSGDSLPPPLPSPTPPQFPPAGIYPPSYPPNPYMPPMQNTGKNPWLIGILNLVVPGLGHVLLKNWARGIATFVVTVVLLLIRVFISAMAASGGSDPTTCANIALVVLAIGLFFDGFSAANKYNQLPPHL